MAVLKCVTEVDLLVIYIIYEPPPSLLVEAVFVQQSTHPLLQWGCFSKGFVLIVITYHNPLCFEDLTIKCNLTLCDELGCSFMLELFMNTFCLFPLR